MRVLDEVADAIRLARRGWNGPPRSEVELETLFEGPITSRQWAALQYHLNCPFPRREFDQGHWFRTDEFSTVWDLVDHVAAFHPDWETPVKRTPSVWRNAQIFAVVRTVLVDAGNLDPKDVAREARLMRDLGLM